ncbi:MAG: hypothetical protein J7K15_11750 [Deltaproteobacteria bacterium]|nr:hypothetical protein [Deltaproteobacteria bacterium]
MIKKVFKNQFGDVIEAIAVPLEINPKMWVLVIVRNYHIVETKVVTEGLVERIIQKWEEMAKKPSLDVVMKVLKYRKDGVWYVEASDGYVYVGGNTYPIRDKLKALGFRWDSGAGLWKAKAEKVDFEKLKELGAKEIQVSE